MIAKADCFFEHRNAVFSKTNEDKVMFLIRYVNEASSHEWNSLKKKENAFHYNYVL